MADNETEKQYDDFTDPAGKKFRNVIVEGRKFRIAQITAMVGSWLLENADSADERIHRRVEEHLFSACSYYRETDSGEVAMKLFEAPDRWYLPELEFDLIVTRELAQEVIAFNLGPFLRRQRDKTKQEREAKKQAPVAS